MRASAGKTPWHSEKGNCDAFGIHAAARFLKNPALAFLACLTECAAYCCRVRSHPKNPWIKNGSWAALLIFFSRHRVPVFRSLFTRFLGCDIGVPLPDSVFLPHPQGIVIHSQTRIGHNVIIGHQVTLGGRDISPAAPVIEDGVYIGAGAKILGGVTVGRGPPWARTPL